MSTTEAPKHWTIRGEERHISYVCKLGAGGAGEVHKASRSLKLWLTFLKMYNKSSRASEYFVAPLLPLGSTIRTVMKKYFARKIIRPFADLSEEDVQNELRVIDKLCRNGHPNIVQVYRHGSLQRDSAYYYIDMELCEFTLDDCLCGRPPDWLARTGARTTAGTLTLAAGILNALVFIHGQGEVHRDISPQNGGNPQFLRF